MTLTLADMHRDLADILQEDPAFIDVDDDLIDVGLDSVRAMALMERWNAQGAGLVFSALAERSTLRSWWELIAPQAADGA